MRKRSLLAIAALALALLLALAAGIWAQGPGEEPSAPEAVDAVSARIPIQGRLVDSSGIPVPNGTYSVTYRLYAASTGGVALCSDPGHVSVQNGLFSDYMEGCTGGDVNGRSLYLSVQVGSDAEMSPRQAIYPVPYAWSLRPGAIISSSTGAAIVHVENWAPDGRGLRAYAMDQAGTNYGIVGMSRSAAGYGGFFYNSGGGTGLSGSSTAGNGVIGQTSNVLTHTTDSGAFGVGGFLSGYSQNDKTILWWPGGLFGGANGVIGISKDPGGHGAVGWSQAATGTGYGVYGRSESSSGRGVMGFANANSGTTYGVYGDVDSPNGYAVYGRAIANNANYGVFSYGNFAATGSKAAVVKTSDGYRSFYSMESPEVWFEDFGVGQMADGVGQVSIDSLFAQATNLNATYHVFLTPLGDCGLYVAEKTSQGFTVRALGEAKCSVAFDYRLVAKRAGYEGERLERAADPQQLAAEAAEEQQR